MSKEKTQSSFPILSSGAIIFLTVVTFMIIMAWFFTPCIIAKWGSSTSIQDKGQFGDQFGAINTLFTALAFILLLINAIFQKEQLLIQKKEYKETINSLREEKDRQERLEMLHSKAYKIEVLQLKFTLEKDLLNYLKSKSGVNPNIIKNVEKNLDGLEAQINTIYSDETA